MKRVKLGVTVLSILLAVSVALNLYQATYSPDIPRQKGEVYVVYGKVIDYYTKEPIEKAEVLLIRAGGIVVCPDETKSDGYFELLAIGNEMYEVSVRKGGYYNASRVADFKREFYPNGIDLEEIELIPIISLLETEG